MKYILIFCGIIAMVTYVFVAGPKVVSGRDESAEDRQQALWEHIGRLEARRQDMLVRARGRLGASAPRQRASRGGAWIAGYQGGFEQGYFVGSFLAESRRPNPLFFPVPNP